MRWRYVTGALLILVLCGIGGYSLGWRSAWAWVISAAMFVAAVALADRLVKSDRRRQQQHDSELAKRLQAHLKLGNEERGDAW